MKRCYKYFTRQKEIESKDMKVMEMATFIPMKEGLKGEWSAMPTNSEAISHDTYLYFLQYYCRCCAAVGSWLSNLGFEGI
jgi:hypothetical protein